MNDTYEDKFYSINVMKIKSGIDVMINWWKSIPDNYRPENLIFFTKACFQGYFRLLFSAFPILKKYKKVLK